MLYSYSAADNKQGQRLATRGQKKGSGPGAASSEASCHTAQGCRIRTSQQPDDIAPWREQSVTVHNKGQAQHAVKPLGVGLSSWAGVPSQQMQKCCLRIYTGATAAPHTQRVKMRSCSTRKAALVLQWLQIVVNLCKSFQNAGVEALVLGCSSDCTPGLPGEDHLAGSSASAAAAGSPLCRLRAPTCLE